MNEYIPNVKTVIKTALAIMFFTLAAGLISQFFGFNLTKYVFDPVGSLNIGGGSKSTGT